MPASLSDPALLEAISRNVRDALAEDIGPGDLTAALIDPNEVAGAQIVARESLVLAGQPWVDEVFRSLDRDIVIDWYVADGQSAESGDVICKLVGNARALLTGERSALNFLQTLSATATVTAAYVAELSGTRTRLLDTRKTIPGLRRAQKYAVSMGGGHNHRTGLYDAILVKENHIQSAGSIANAVSAVSTGTSVIVEVEVESLAELREALDAGVKRLLLDNFALDDLALAVQINRERGEDSAELEASGNIGIENLREVAETGVDYISVGAVTKNVDAVDLSMLFRMEA